MKSQRVEMQLLWGSLFPEVIISLGIKEFPQDQNIRKEYDDVFSDKLYLITCQQSVEKQTLETLNTDSIFSKM